MPDREVTPHFLDTAVKKAVLGPLSKGLAAALARTKPIPGKPPASFGAECDLLALDKEGRLLAVEVKPSVSSLVWTPAQATMYARPAGLGEGRRRKPGLESGRHRNARPEAPARPCAARPRRLARRTSRRPGDRRPARRQPRARQQALKVQQALLDEGVGDPALEVYQVSLSGRLDRIEA